MSTITLEARDESKRPSSAGLQQPCGFPQVLNVSLQPSKASVLVNRHDRSAIMQSPIHNTKCSGSCPQKLIQEEKHFCTQDS